MRLDNHDGKETSTICMAMTSSSGTWLNGAMVPQHHYVSLTVKDNQGKLVARVALTFEQMTRTLMYNGEVPCTLERYRGDDGQLVEEKVERPKTVRNRMKERLGTSRQELKTRIADLKKDLYEAVAGGSAGKKKLEGMLAQADTILSHFGENDDFVVQQAEEELGAMQTQAACQLGVFLQTQHNLTVDESALVKLLPVGEASNLLTDKSVQGVTTGYVAKERVTKSAYDMTAMEVADAIHRHLKYWEATPWNKQQGEHQPLFGASATHKGNKVEIRYVSFQGTHSLTLKAAQDYLVGLNNAKGFKRHL
jgi:hypothetical protein